MKRLSRGNTALILNGNLIKAMLSIAVPVIMSSFLQTLYNLTDSYWLGKLGTEPLAAINLVTPLQNIVINFGSGLTVAGAVLIAQFIGAGKARQAKSIANQIFLAAMAFSLAFATALAVLTPAMVTWLGADGDTWQHAVTYLRLVILDMPFLFMVNIYQSTRQAQGDTLRPMLLNLLGVSVNMLLDPLLMVVLDLGTAGAALATVLAKAVPAVIAFCLLLDRHEPIHLDQADMRPDPAQLKEVVRIGLPTALGSSMFQLGFLLMTRNVLAYGVEAVAAYGIGNRINGLVTLPGNAVGSAVSTIVGQNMGARQVDRARKGFQLGVLFSVCFLLVGGMILSQPQVAAAIVSIFAQDATVIALAADYLQVIAFWCWSNALLDCCAGLFQGSGHTEVTMTINITRIWVLRFATLWFFEAVLQMGVRSVWYSVVASNGISALILLGLYFTGLWKKPRIKLEA